MTEAGSTLTGREAEPAAEAPAEARRSPRRRHLRWLLVVVAVIGLGAAAIAAGSALGGPTTDPAEVRAKASAQQLLQRFTPPPGARAVSGTGRLSTAPAMPVTPDVFDLHRSWTVAGDPATVVRWLHGHPPAGLQESGGANGGIQDMKAISYGPPIGGAAVPGNLWVAVVRNPGGGSEIRADAITTWTPTRPSAATIPRGATRIDLAHTLPMGPTPTQPVHRVTITKAGDVAALVSALNARPLARTGAFSCPLDQGEHDDLAVRGPGGTSVADARVEVGGCGGVSLHVVGQKQIALEGSGQLRALLARLDP